MLLYRGDATELPPLLLGGHPQQQQYHDLHQHLQAENANPEQLQEDERRRQQEHDVMKIRSMVNAINLRQLQHFQQQHARNLAMRQSLDEENHEKPNILAKQTEAPAVPAQLKALNGVGSQ